MNVTKKLIHAWLIFPTTRRYSTERQIEKILIANRGEIACRVIRTARKLGIKTVAIYSDVDRNALHVEQADEAYSIGSGESLASYLSTDAIIKIGKDSKCQAIHPGYGFLSENPEFAELCHKSGIEFIGPPSSAIRDMGIKSKSKLLMIQAGVPVITGYSGNDQTYERLFEEAKKVGFPLMIKAVRGGGGKGMRIALKESDFKEALESAKVESLKCFGNDDVLIERFIQNPRHVEVQIFADKHGNVVHLFERDCSVQRRHQKIIEEAPAPGVSVELRKRLGAAATAAAKAVNYVGAGTVEFILDRDTLDFHFMEMNTRLQVEHPITEMITGVDLVEWQIDIASGKPLPMTQDEIKLRGHSFEARIYAEDPYNDFLPCTGRLKEILTPEPAENVRVEMGVQQGDTISVHFDPMIAKLVVWDQDRAKALQLLKRKLSEFNILGLTTNKNFLMHLSSHPEFVAGNVYTNFIHDHAESLLKPPKLEVSRERVLLTQAVIGYILHRRLNALVKLGLNNPFALERSFRMNHQLIKKYVVEFEGEDKTIFVKYVENDKFEVSTDNQQTWTDVTGKIRKFTDKTRMVLTCYQNGAKLDVEMFVDPGSSGHGADIHLFTEDGQRTASIQTLHTVVTKLIDERAKDDTTDSSNVAISPMPGIIEKIHVAEGGPVKKGDVLFVIVAMKMEHVVKSGIDGIVRKINFAVKDYVDKDDRVVELE